MSKNEKTSEQSEEKTGKNWLEWLIFGLSCLLVSATLGYLVFLAVTQRDSPPNLVLQIGQSTRSASGFQVPITVENRGDQTAQTAEIEITFEDGKTMETASFTLDYVPHGSKRRGAVTFSRQPKKEQLSARVVSYQLP